MKPEEWQERISKASKSMNTEIEKEFLKIGGKIISESMLEHLSGPKMPRGVGSEENATLQPHSGDLRRFMKRKEIKQGNTIVGVKVSSGVDYAAVHEFGYPRKNIPKRSYLWPVVKKYRPVMKEYLEHVLKELLGG